ncbi:SDR family NAD(P)-dependent oxidoreductase [Streptomyces sp. JNUCC 63]
MGKVAVITGGASGLGLATVERFSEEGATVVAVDRDAEVLGKATGELPGVSARVADVSSAEEMKELAESVLREHGRVDVVFANAGVEGVGTAGEVSEEHWQRVIDVNLTGVWLTSKFFLASMVEAGGGSVINTAGVGGLVGVAKIFPYAAAKGGVIAMTRQMAVDYSPHGVRVNAICPGTVVTPLVTRNWEQKGQNPQEQTERLAARHLVRRAGEPADVASTALFLASDDSSWVTGTTITVDGGHTAV